MAEKDYEAKIAGAKAALESYSAEQEAITRLYEQARQNAQSRYETQQRQLQDRLASDRNRAAVEQLRTEKNINQTLASRGLAFSGENAQTKLDLSLALRGQLADLDREAGEQRATLEQEHAESQENLDLEQAKQRSQYAEKLVSLQGDLASLQMQKQAAAAGTSNGTGGSDGSAASGSNASSAKSEMMQQADRTWIGDKEFKNNFAQRLRQSLLEQERKKEQAAVTLSPSVSAQQLAKQLVTAVSSTGKIYGYTQQSRATELLEGLLAENSLEDGYYRELLLNLRSLGYNPNYADDLNKTTQAVREKAKEMYDAYCERYRNLYGRLGYAEGECETLARREARFGQLAYVYANSSSKSLFEETVRLMGLQNELDSFYEEVEKRNEKQPGQYTIGSALS